MQEGRGPWDGASGALFTQRKIMKLGPQRIVGIGVSLVATGALASLVVYAVAAFSGFALMTRKARGAAAPVVG
ncbi:hypothetical protein E8F11_19880 [Pseudomonas sp. BN417]|uniref:hypothetical protein n=1 Tax=Pseudomonas sp. BN417 TaxID=2567890 RepID=UPI00245523F8|nr:hypothetical protein [Pseudomonas sp. BN417]MDH4557409.1 hypothetical protein [Pseudomonas sp. BN417]